jgi:zinc transporter ZupT
MVSSSENVPAAFGLVCMSGFSTAIGSAVVFFPALVSVVNRKTLAASLALSAGVMTYGKF